MTWQHVLTVTSKQKEPRIQNQKPKQLLVLLPADCVAGGVATHPYPSCKPFVAQNAPVLGSYCLAVGFKWESMMLPYALVL